MTAHVASLINSLFLIGFGLWAYFGADTPSKTALIPVAFGSTRKRSTPASVLANTISRVAELAKQTPNIPVDRLSPNAFPPVEVAAHQCRRNTFIDCRAVECNQSTLTVAGNADPGDRLMLLTLSVSATVKLSML